MDLKVGDRVRIKRLNPFILDIFSLIAKKKKYVGKVIKVKRTFLNKDIMYYLIYFGKKGEGWINNPMVMCRDDLFKCRKKRML